MSSAFSEGGEERRRRVKVEPDRRHARRRARLLARPRRPGGGREVEEEHGANLRATQRGADDLNATELLYLDLVRLPTV